MKARKFLGKRDRNPLTMAVKTAAGIAITTCAVHVGAQSLVLEEVIVTAQKRAEGLQDVPIAVSAISGKCRRTSSARLPGSSSTLECAGLSALVCGATGRAAAGDRSPTEEGGDKSPHSKARPRLVNRKSSLANRPTMG